MRNSYFLPVFLKISYTDSCMRIILDEKDRFILKQLRENGRMPFLKIAEKLNCSEGLVRKRVKRLIENGVIRGFTANVDLQAPLEAIVCIKTETKKTKDVLEALQRFSENISQAFEVMGRFDIICILHAQETKELNKTIDAIRETKSVLATESFLVAAKR